MGRLAKGEFYRGTHLSTAVPGSRVGKELMVPLVAKVNHVVSQPTFAYEGWLTVTVAGAKQERATGTLLTCA